MLHHVSQVWTTPESVLAVTQMFVSQLVSLASLHRLTSTNKAGLDFLAFGSQSVLNALHALIVAGHLANWWVKGDFTVPSPCCDKFVSH